MHKASVPSMHQTQTMDHSMKMYFNTDLPYTLLFSTWIVDTIGKAVGACVGTFLLAILYEALNGLRQHLLLRSNCGNQCTLPNHGQRTTPLVDACPSCPSAEASSNKIDLSSSELADSVSFGRHCFYNIPLLQSYRSGYHYVQTVLHLVNVFLSYILMLIVMTYNVYLMLAVIFGMAIGYFLFSSRQVFLFRSTNCCH